MSPSGNAVDPQPGITYNVDEISVRNSFKELISKANIHPRRLKKLSDITRDKEIAASLTNRIEQSDDPLMKSSLWYKLFRTFEIQAELLPKTTASKKDASDIELNVVDCTKDLIYEDGDFDATYLRVSNDGFRKEGITFVETGYGGEDDFITLKKHQFANVFTDYDKDTISSDQADLNSDAARWAAVRVGLELGDVLQLYPQLEGKVQKGDFLVTERTGALNATAGNTFSPTATDKVWLYYCWSIIQNEPQMIVFVGGNAEIAEYNVGKNYPYWKKRINNKEYAHVPIVDLHFTKVGEGICTMSQIGVMADIAAADQKIANISLPGIKKVVNKIIAVFSPEGADIEGSDAAIRDSLMLAQERQSLGINPVVPLPAGTTMETIAPDSGIITDYQAAKNIIYDVASDRFDIDFQRLSNDEVKATVFVGKTKTEIQAIGGVYKINRNGYNRIAENTVALAARTWKMTESRNIKITIDEAAEDSIELNASVVMGALRDWTGRFVTDVDIKIPLSNADKSAALVDLDNQEFGIFYGRPWKSVEEIQRDLVGLNRRARLAGLEDDYRVASLLKKAEAILKTNAEAAAASIPRPGQVNETEKSGAMVDNTNRDIAAELAPQTALAEAAV